MTRYTYQRLQLAQKDENLTHAMIVYDVQAVLLRWFR